MQNSKYKILKIKGNALLKTVTTILLAKNRWKLETAMIWSNIEWSLPPYLSFYKHHNHLPLSAQSRSLNHSKIWSNKSVPCGHARSHLSRDVRKDHREYASLSSKCRILYNSYMQGDHHFRSYTLMFTCNILVSMYNFYTAGNRITIKTRSTVPCEENTAQEHEISM